MLNLLIAFLRAIWARLTEPGNRGQGPVDLLALAGLIALASLAVTAALGHQAGVPGMP
jgi:hypothetical protein